MFSHEGRVGVKWHREAWMLVEPLLDTGGVYAWRSCEGATRLPGGFARFSSGTSTLGVGVATLCDDFCRQNVERCKHRSSKPLLVIVRHRLRPLSMAGRAGYGRPPAPGSSHRSTTQACSGGDRTATVFAFSTNFGSREILTTITRWASRHVCLFRQAPWCRLHTHFAGKGARAPLSGRRRQRSGRAPPDLCRQLPTHLAPSVQQVARASVARIAPPANGRSSTCAAMACFSGPAPPTTLAPGVARGVPVAVRIRPPAVSGSARRIHRTSSRSANAESACGRRCRPLTAAPKARRGL